MTEYRSGWHAAPLHASAFMNEPINVERIHRRDEFPVAIPPPVARPVRADLDAEAVGIGQLHCLGIQVIGHPRVAAGLKSVLEKTAERLAVRQGQREVKQAQSPPTRHGVRDETIARRDDCTSTRLAHRLFHSTPHPP